MTPKELLDAGQLDEAIRELTGQVKARPSDTSLRVFLFELLAFAGEHERARKQLDVIAGQGGDVATGLAVQVYRDLLAAERVREQVFHGDALPKFLLPPPPHVDRYVMLVKALARAPREAAAMLSEAEEQCPAVTGRIGERAFTSLRDGDDRVAPVVEAFHGASYLWLPLDQIRSIEVTPPRTLRDLAWAHARIETYDESVGDVFVPALYVDSGRHADAQVRLGRMTEWQAVEDSLVCGAGRRVFLVDDEEVSLFELGEVRIDPPAGGMEPE
jgi:type VI secretion system protein ImpE